MDPILKEETRAQWSKNVYLIIIALAIKLVSLRTDWIEKYYSTGIYPRIAKIQRLITGSIPFSIGDILYGIWMIMLILFVFRFIRDLVTARLERGYFWLATAKNFTKLLWIYIFFNLLWGLNYNRYGIADQLGLKEEKYGKEEVMQLTQELIAKVNASRLEMGDSFQYPSRTAIYDSVAKAYSELSVQYPYLKYENRSVKSSLYGKLGNKFGFLGYYNPFSGEAQLNVRIPDFLLPFVATHEVAHQLGYAYENEANFVGYLASTTAKQPMFHYSVYFDLFMYANGELAQYDSAQAKNNYKQFDTLVRRDVRELREYYKLNKNPFEPIIRMLYGEFLKINNQPKGINSYNEVVGALLAYRRKFGKI
jgi:hypothetical protein